MKKLLTVITTLLISMSALSQNDYQDLLIIKADGKWDDLIKKSERYTLKSSTQKDPVPSYYLAYGLYKISFDADRDDNYKNEYQDASTATYNMLMNDKDGEVQEQQAEFI